MAGLLLTDYLLHDFLKNVLSASHLQLSTLLKSMTLQIAIRYSSEYVPQGN